MFKQKFIEEVRIDKMEVPNAYLAVEAFGTTLLYRERRRMSSYYHGPIFEPTFRALIGPDRMAPFLAKTGGDVHVAVELYTWNSALSAVFLAPIGVLEVALRNRLSAQLESKFAPEWYDDPSFLGHDPTGQFARKIKTAKDYIHRANPPRLVTLSRITPELPFSFWVSLLKPTYNRTLWPVLRPAFNKYTRRKAVMRDLQPLVAFRNRVAHHEPIYDRSPLEMYNRLLVVASLLTPGLGDWIERHSRVRELTTSGPNPPATRF